jgi:hypothetical protein
LEPVFGIVSPKAPSKTRRILPPVPDRPKTPEFTALKNTPLSGIFQNASEKYGLEGLSGNYKL